MLITSQSDIMNLSRKKLDQVSSAEVEAFPKSEDDYSTLLSDNVPRPLLANDIYDSTYMKDIYSTSGIFENCTWGTR